MNQTLLPRSFFQRHPLVCAQELIGCELVWENCSGIIVETEAYASQGDPASHTFSRKSAREFVASNPPGTAYVYFNYGMYWLFNVLTKCDEADGFVLIRALEPVSGVDTMRQRRKKDKLEDLCSGPGKLAQALGIVGEHHGCDLCARSKQSFRYPDQPMEAIADVRIGISRAKEFPWRFLSKNLRFVSARPS